MATVVKHVYAYSLNALIVQDFRTRSNTEKAMKYGSILLVLSATIFSGCSPPNVDELDQDISELANRIEIIEEELAAYEGGLIHSLIETRKQLTGTTRDMLEQKRASLVYWIELKYPIEGVIQEPASEESLQSIIKEIEELESEVVAAEAEASYSGGLIGAMKMAQVATLQLSLATVRHRYYAQKYGVPVMLGSSETESSDDRAVIDPSEL